MLTLLLLGQAPTPEAILKRFDQYMAAADTLAVTVKLKINNRAVGTGSIRIDRPNRFSVSITTPGGVESLTFNETGAIEVSHGGRIYADHPLIGRLYMPENKVTSAIGYATPGLLLKGNSKGTLGQGANYKATQNVMVNGIATDQIAAKQEGMGGSSEVRMNFDSAGRLLKSFNKTVTPNGTLIIEQDLSGYVTGTKFTDAQFSIRRPIGYTPFELARADFGVPQGEILPSIELKSAASGGSVQLKTLAAGKNALVVVSDPEFHANAEMFKSIRQISSRIPDFKLVVICARRDAASAQKLGVADAYFDPTGTQLEKLYVPGSPAMYLLDKKGAVAQMFFGFDGEWVGLDKAIERLAKSG